MADDLEKQHCVPCEGGISPLSPAEADRLLTQVSDWQADAERRSISREFRFKNFHETMAFVNALAWIAHREDHHPDLAVGYNRCTVRYSTHAIGGLSPNDFICAARIDTLLA